MIGCGAEARAPDNRIENFMSAIGPCNTGWRNPHEWPNGMEHPPAAGFPHAGYHHDITQISRGRWGLAGLQRLILSGCPAEQDPPVNLIGQKGGFGERHPPGLGNPRDLGQDLSTRIAPPYNQYPLTSQLIRRAVAGRVKRHAGIVGQTRIRRNNGMTGRSGRTDHGAGMPDTPVRVNFVAMRKAAMTRLTRTGRCMGKLYRLSYRVR